MKVLRIDMTVARKDNKDFDESIEDEFVDALIDVVEDFDLVTFVHMRVVDDEDDD